MKSRNAKVIRVSNIATWIPKKSKKSHKKSSGELLIIAGSKKYPGASRLAVEAASRVGAGYVHLLSSQPMGSLFPDVIPTTHLTRKNLDRFSVILVGPGLTNKAQFLRHLQLIQRSFRGLVIFDASALNWIAETKNLKLGDNTLLTPHEGEMARLIGRSSRWITSHRQEAVEMAIQKYQCSILLKGDGSLLASSKELFKIKAGNAALAKAGTGDILSGMIAGFALQTEDLTRSALMATAIHGTVADLWVKEKSDILSLTPNDILQKLPKLLFNIRKKKILIHSNPLGLTFCERKYS